jgi:hypothetical protein
MPAQKPPGDNPGRGEKTMTTQTNTREEKKEAAVMAMLLLVAYMPVVLWSGFVVSKLWLWFAVPWGLPAATTAQVAGAMLIYRAFVLKAPHPRDNVTVEQSLASYAALSATYAVVLVTGFIIKAFF